MKHAKILNGLFKNIKSFCLKSTKISYVCLSQWTKYYRNHRTRKRESQWLVLILHICVTKTWGQFHQNIYDVFSSCKHRTKFLSKILFHQILILCEVLTCYRKFKMNIYFDVVSGIFVLNIVCLRLYGADNTIKVMSSQPVSWNVYIGRYSSTCIRDWRRC